MDRFVFSSVLVVLVSGLLCVQPAADLKGMDHPGTVIPCEDGERPFQVTDLDDLFRNIDGRFIENKGQVDNPEVRFYARGHPLSIGLTDDSVHFSLTSGEAPDHPVMAPMGDQLDVKSTHFSFQFLECNDVTPSGVGPLDSPTHFFLGDDPGRWSRTIGTYSEVIYHDLYDGVDLRFYFMSGMFKYDLVLEEWADHSSITLRYEGIDGLSIDPLTGDLIISTPIGDLRDMRPTYIPTHLDAENGFPGDYLLMDPFTVGFAIADDLPINRPWIIDPGLEFSTYLGGSDIDLGNAIDVDRDGNVIVAGTTASIEFPSTQGSYDDDGNLSLDWDAFVVKMDPNGSSLLFSTFIGGSGLDQVLDMEMAPNGDILLLGCTDSRDFPIVGNPLYPYYMGGILDGFVFQLDRTGSRCNRSTYLGGDDADLPQVFRLWNASLYIFGDTGSTDLPTTAGAHALNPIAMLDNFVMKISENLDTLGYCTYIGGSGTDNALDCMVGPDGNLYLAGATTSKDYHTHQGSFDGSNPEEGQWEGFVTKMGDLGQIIHSTYLGGKAGDYVQGINVSQDGRVYLTGHTFSEDFPRSPDAIEPYSQGAGDAFIVILDNNLSKLEYGTYFGSWGIDNCGVIGIDPGGESVTIAGVTESTFATTVGCFDPTHPENTDVCMYVAVINITTRKYTYCTHIGGNGDEGIGARMGLTLGPDSVIYITGITFSDDFPTTPGAYDRTYDGDRDAFVLKLDPRPCGIPEPPKNVTPSFGEGTVNISWDPPSDLGTRKFQHKLYRGTSPQNLHLIQYSDWPMNEILDEDVVCGVTYYYAVSALNSAGEGNLSRPVRAVPFGIPGPVKDLEVTSGLGVVALSWTPPSEDGGGLQGYRILRSKDPDGVTLKTTMANLTSDTIYFIDENVTLGETYHYAVVAYNRLFHGPIGETASIEVVAPPSQPKDLSITVDDGEIRLAWTPPSSDGGSEVLGYHVFRGTELAGIEYHGSRGPLSRTHRDVGLVNGRVYYYRISAYSIVGEGKLSEIVSGTPFGIPQAPYDVEAECGDEMVHLQWSPPVWNNGRPILGYTIYYAEGTSSIRKLADVPNITSYDHLGLVNGREYSYEITSRNEAGESLRSRMVSTTPIGPPGTVLSLTCENQPEGVLLGWDFPSDKGGAKEVYVRVLRGTSEDSTVEIFNTTTGTEYLDLGASQGDTYLYCVVCGNDMHEGPPMNATITFVTIPGRVRDLTCMKGDRRVELSWAPPSDGGGLPVTGYVVSRSTDPSFFFDIAILGEELSFTDLGVSNGQTYYYVVQAINDMGTGPMGLTIEVTPLGMIGSPGGLIAMPEEGMVFLTWTAPSKARKEPLTGYNLYRGNSTAEMELLVELDVVGSFVDTDVLPGTVYYYSIAGTCRLGEGAKTRILEVTVPAEEPVKADDTRTLAIIVAVVLVVVTSIGWVLYSTLRRERALAAEIALREATPVYPYVVERVLILHREGRLVSECSREDCRTEDLEMMSGVLVAIQGIAEEGLMRGGELQSVEFGTNLVVIAGGEHINLAVVLYGEPTEDLMEEMLATINSIEASYAGVIEDWDGDLAPLMAGIEGMVMPLIKGTSELSREDVTGEVAEGGVSLLSSVEFHQGYVKLKVAAVNLTDKVILDTAVEVHYHRDMLRLEQVEPPGWETYGDRVDLGNIKPQERVMVAFLFDPQICQMTYLEGTLSYYDTKGELHGVDMKRRRASVVCPVFMTQGTANTAMLRRLIKTELHESDMRAFRYPDGTDPAVVLRMGKSVLDEGSLQLVREHVEEGPSFEAEVWYYGETKVTARQIVIRLGVVEEKGLLEYFVASTSMEIITGLLAEVRRGLTVIDKDFRGEEVPPDGGEGADGDGMRSKALPLSSLLDQ